MIPARARLALTATLSVGLSGCFALLLLAPKISAAALPDRPGKDVYVQRCGSCHSLVDPASVAHRYGEILDRYRDQLVITAEEREQLAGYMASFAASAEP